MAKEQEDKKKGFSVLPVLVEFVADIVGSIKQFTEEEVKTLRKKIANFILLYSVVAIAVVFILVGLVKYLAEIYVFSSEGIGFLVVGSIMIVLLSLYNLIHQ